MLRIKMLVTNLVNKISGHSSPLIQTQSIHHTVPEDFLVLYNNYKLVKANTNAKFIKKLLMEDLELVNKLKIFFKNDDKKLYEFLDSKQFSSFVRGYIFLLKHPASVKIIKSEGDYYIINIINYTHSSEDIKIGAEIIKKREIGTYVKNGEEIKQYIVDAIYNWKIKKVTFHELMRVATLAEQQAILGYKNIENAYELIENQNLTQISFSQCTVTRLLDKAFKFENYKTLGDMSGDFNNKGKTSGLSEPEL